jgi:hypothetical protein
MLLRRNGSAFIGSRVEIVIAIMKYLLFLKRMASAFLMVAGATILVAICIAWAMYSKDTYLQFVWNNLPLYVKGIFFMSLGISLWPDQ